ncbi:unnamed protein product [Brassica oleracea var. botrytis]|uniref:Uncharacterized protein n=2 Tax=Brassica TaxID=3705 RepID=A0A0D2ZWT3_BRAOL|nr:unnamed protein product [Brassica napus]
MEKISMKLAFFIFIAISSVMSITETGANRLLQEEASQTVLLHHEASSQEAINPNKIHCKKGCHIECVPNPFIVECFCQC